MIFDFGFSIADCPFAIEGRMQDVRRAEIENRKPEIENAKIADFRLKSTAALR